MSTTNPMFWKFHFPPNTDKKKLKPQQAVAHFALHAFEARPTSTRSRLSGTKNTDLRFNLLPYSGPTTRTWTYAILRRSLVRAEPPNRRTAKHKIVFMTIAAVSVISRLWCGLSNTILVLSSFQSVTFWHGFRTQHFGGWREQFLRWKWFVENFAATLIEEGEVWTFLSCG